MLRRCMRSVKPKLLATRILWALLLVSGCYWSQYPEVMEMHLELLEQYASKVEAVARSKAEVPPSDWGEFAYPLERAEDFARIAAQRYPTRASLRDFRGVLKRYSAIVDNLGALSQPGGMEELARRRKALRHAVEATRVQLRRESE